MAKKKYTVHNCTNHELYNVWNAMMNRVYNKKDKGHRLYGARGITVCKRWHDVRNFIADMHPRPTGRSIERVNNDKGYSPKNCKWATAAEQAHNRRRTIVYKGENATHASKRLGGSPRMVDARVRKGWDLKRAFTIKSRYATKHHSKSRKGG